MPGHRAVEGLSEKGRAVIVCGQILVLVDHEVLDRAGVLWGAIEAEEKRTFFGRWSSLRDAAAEKVRALATGAS